MIKNIHTELPVIPALKRPRQEGGEFKTILGYIVSSVQPGQPT
jgi:hypothetical protein